MTRCSRTFPFSWCGERYSVFLSFYSYLSVMLERYTMWWICACKKKTKERCTWERTCAIFPICYYYYYMPCGLAFSPTVSDATTPHTSRNTSKSIAIPTSIIISPQFTLGGIHITGQAAIQHKKKIEHNIKYTSLSTHIYTYNQSNTHMAFKMKTQPLTLFLSLLLIGTFQSVSV